MKARSRLKTHDRVAEIKIRPSEEEALSQGLFSKFKKYSIRGPTKLNFKINNTTFSSKLTGRIIEKIEFSTCYIEPTQTFLAFMDWINCNTCCRQPGDDKERIFMLSSCGHIFCDSCLNKLDSKDKCRVCSTPCQLIHLSSKMKPDTQIFFQDPSSLLKQHQMQMMRLLEFQKEHRTRLVTFHRKILFKYKELEEKCKMASEKIQHLERENENLKKALNSGILGVREITTDNGELVAHSPGSIYATPHQSYQKVINASGNRNSPQATSSFISPGTSRISPGRLSLVKGKNTASPDSKMNNHCSMYSPHETVSNGIPSQKGEIKKFFPSQTSLPSSQSYGGQFIGDNASGAAFYNNGNKCNGKRTPSPTMRENPNCIPSSPSIMYQSSQPSTPRYFTPGSSVNQSYSQMPPRNQPMRIIPSHSQRLNYANTPQPMLCSPDSSLLQRSSTLTNRSYQKFF